jgi:hypothetical protein
MRHVAAAQRIVSTRIDVTDGEASCVVDNKCPPSVVSTRHGPGKVRALIG